MTAIEFLRLAVLGGLMGGCVTVFCLWLGSAFAGALSRRADRWCRIQDARDRTLSREMPHV